jgi:hypothetical protein
MNGPFVGRFYLFTVKTQRRRDISGMCRSDFSREHLQLETKVATKTKHSLRLRASAVKNIISFTGAGLSPLMNANARKCFHVVAWFCHDHVTSIQRPG